MAQKRNKRLQIPLTEDEAEMTTWAAEEMSLSEAALMRSLAMPRIRDIVAKRRPV